MNLLLFVILLALGWAAATGNFSLPNLLLGAAIGGLALFVVRAFVTGSGTLGRLLRILSLAWTFVAELFVSAFRVALLVLRPDLGQRIRPAIIAYPLRVTSDAEITLLANLITLTPGTLSLDVSPDRKLLFIHAIDVGDRAAFIAGIRDGFERKVAGAFR